jgi:hypothetical protein
MRALSALLLSGSLTACGARTGLAVGGADAGLGAADVLTADVTRADVTATDVTATDVTASACAWTPSEPVALTVGDRDRSPQAVRVLDDRLWVGFQSSNPDPPGNLGRFVRVADALGRPVAPATEVLPSPGDFVTYGPLSLWTDPVTRAHAAMSWTEGVGCVAASLDDRGRPTGARVRLGDVDCGGVVRTARGWTYLTRGSASLYTRLHAADPMGVETASVALAPDGAALSAAARAVLDDGRFVFGWAARGAGRFALTPHAAEGAALGPSSEYPTQRAGATVLGLRLVPDGATVLAAWVDVPAGETVGLVRVARVGLDGAPRVAPVLAGSVRVQSGRPLELALAVAQGIPGVVWNPSDSGDEGALRLTTMDPTTLRPTGAVVAATARFPRNLSLRGTSQGFVAVFGGIAPPTLTQVWTAAFRCLAPG